MANLTWKKTILLSAGILAVAVIAASFSPATSQGRGSSFMITGNGNSQFVWRVNVATGSVSYCVRRDDSTDERFIAQRPPYCSAQSPAVQ